MDLGLSGQVAIVTGGRSGIGAAIALGLAHEGCDVAVVDRVVDDRARETARGIEAAGRRAQLVEADVRDFAAAEAVVGKVIKEFGRLDIVVGNAGTTADALSWKMSEEQWDTVLDVNLKGCFAYARAAAPVLRERHGGRIVFIASINGLRGKAGQANYAASKAGVIALGKTLGPGIGPLQRDGERRGAGDGAHGDDGGAARRSRPARGGRNRARQDRHAGGHCRRRRVPLLGASAARDGSCAEGGWRTRHMTGM